MVPSREGKTLAVQSEMGHRIQEFDWARTPLGPLDKWPQSLKTSVSIILGSQHPMWIGWGPENTFLYNDPYIEVLSRHKHPWALGRPAAKVWAEIWDICGPLSDQVFLEGKASFLDDVRLFMKRADFLEETYFSFSYSPIQNESGRVGGLFCPSTDTTARVLSERRLRTLSELSAKSLIEKEIKAACARAMSTLSENPDDIPFAALYLLSPQKNLAVLEGTVGIPGANNLFPVTVELGAASSDQTHWPIDEVFRNSKSQILKVPHPDELPRGLADQKISAAMILPVIAPGQIRPMGALIVGANPTRRLDPSYITFFELISGQLAAAMQNAMATEEEKKRARQLAELDRAKTAFFSNISHEFRTPLTLMLGPLEDSLTDMVHPLSPEQRNRLELTHRNGLRLLKLVNTLLQFSRIEAGRVQATYEPTDLAALTSDLASVFRSATEKAGLKFIVDCPPIPTEIYVDREMWEKIVLNLISNAFKFTLSGEIRVSLRPIAHAIEFVVRDTGTGIPAEEIPHLFERFHRVKNARGRSHEGSGIGLALVQELVNLHRGKIEVTSEVGRGTEFKITIPEGSRHLPPAQIGHGSSAGTSSYNAHAYAEEVQRWIPGLPAASASGAPRPSPSENEDPSSRLETTRYARILLADDNADMRDYVKRLLSPHWEVTTVSDGAEAFRVANDHPPHLILTDVMMPVLDGFGLIKALRENPTTREIPIIMLSARAGEEARIEGLHAGADDYLVKPFSARELVARIQATLQITLLRKQASEKERALTAEAIVAREKLETILSTISEGFFVIDHAWRFTFANDQGAKLCRQKKEALLGKTVWEVFPETVGSEFETQLRAARAQLRSARFEYFYESWQRCFETRVYLSAEGLSFFLTDITEMRAAENKTRQTEAELKKQAEQLRLALEAGRMGSWVYDVKSERASFSSEQLRVFGLKPGEFDGRFESIVRCVHPEDRARMQTTFQKALASRDNYECTYRVVFPRGEVHWVLSRGLVIRDENFSALNVLGISIDITDQKEKDESLRQNQELLDAIIQNSPAAIFLKDGSGRLVLANAAVKKLLGDQAVGKLHRECQPADAAYARQVEDNDDIVRKTGLPLETEEEIEHNGTKLTFRSVKFPVEYEAGNRTAVGGVAIEITDLKQTQKKLERSAEELAQSNTELARFAFVASHDLKEPLRVVSNYSQLLSRRYRGKLEGDADLYIGYITQGIARMYELINDLLSYSRVGANRPELESIEANRIAHLALENLAPLIEETGAKIKLSPLPEVYADASQLLQLFQNLIGNALKYRSVAPPEIEIKSTARDENWVFSVRDNGIGIASEYYDKVFVLFQRLHSKDEYSGTGIGLAVCKKIVERHGGRIWIESKIGAGSTFYFSLPRERPQPLAQPQ